MLNDERFGKPAICSVIKIVTPIILLLYITVCVLAFIDPAGADSNVKKYSSPKEARQSMEYTLAEEGLKKILSSQGDEEITGIENVSWIFIEYKDIRNNDAYTMFLKFYCLINGKTVPKYVSVKKGYRYHVYTDIGSQTQYEAVKVLECEEIEKVVYNKFRDEWIDQTDKKVEECNREQRFDSKIVAILWEDARGN